MIDVRKLEILRELDRCGTITATAAAVHLTPSAVSQQLAALSKEAGTPMLEPDGRRVRLSEAATLLLSHAHQIFTHLEHAESDLAAFRRGDAGTVRVGSFSSAVKAIAVPLISDLARHSRLRVEIREVEPETAIDALLARTVDVSMTLAVSDLLPGEHDRRIRSEHLLDDVMDVALPFDHPLAGRAEIELADLAEADWILAQPGVPCWYLTRQACERAGFVPRARHYADEFIGVVGLIAAGHGVGLLPRLAQPEFVNEPIVLRPVAGVSPVRRIGAQIRSGTADQPHIAPVLEALRRISAEVAIGPLECRARADIITTLPPASSAPVSGAAAPPVPVPAG